jgi:hypothetical protein
LYIAERIWAKAQPPASLFPIAVGRAPQDGVPPWEDKEAQRHISLTETVSDTEGETKD